MVANVGAIDAVHTAGRYCDRSTNHCNFVDCVLLLLLPQEGQG